MKFNPKTEQELKAMNLIEPGIYDYQVIDAKDTISKNSGNEMIELKLKIWDIEGRERLVFDYLLESFAHKLRHFAESNSMLDKYEAGQFHASDCLGKSGKAEIIIQKDKTGLYSDKNSVKDYVVFDKLVVQKDLPLKKDTFINDDLPF